MAEQLEGGVERLKAERDRLTQQRDDLLAWLEEQATCWADRARDQELREAAFGAATAYFSVIQRLKEEE